MNKFAPLNLACPLLARYSKSWVKRKIEVLLKAPRRELDVKGSFNIPTFFLFLLLFFIAPCALSLSADKQNFAIIPGTSCISADCHADMANGKEYFHEAATDGELCTECHEMQIEGVHDFIPYKKDEPLCFNCHNAEDFEDSRQHHPGTHAECLKCHHPHGSDNSALLQAPLPKLCLGCHSSEIKDSRGNNLPATNKIIDDKKNHKPFVEGRCTACHLPHQVDSHRRLNENYPAQLYASYNDETYGFCLGCHENLNKHLSKPKTSTDTAFRNGNLNLHYKHINRIKGRTCRTCHHHHSSTNPKLVRKTFAFGKRILNIEYEKTETGGRCAPACHVTVQYDRYQPVENAMKTTPGKG